MGHMKRTVHHGAARTRGSLIVAIGAPCLIALACLLAPVAATADTIPLPLQMADIGDAQQLLIATAPRLGDTTGTLQAFDLVDGAWVETLTVPARFGKRGLMDGAKRKAGNKTTPTGIWAMPSYVFGSHTHAVAGTKMKYKHLSWKSWWSSRRGKTYNTWVTARHWTGEHIGGSPKAYEFAVSTGYNARPNVSVFGRGTGIFLHVQGPGLTSGCVAVSRTAMVRVFKILDRRKRPHFAVGTLEVGTPTSIWAY
jgi:L,D-peptidoglycan transpeptidase YkuD (ErfK/YbiS/YcfS/YnhG family)